MGKRRRSKLTEHEMQDIGRWANGLVGTKFRGHQIYGWTLDGARRDRVKLFTDFECKNYIEAGP